MREQRRLAAIVSADVAGYSRLMGRDETTAKPPSTFIEPLLLSEQEKSLNGPRLSYFLRCAGQGC